jgi:hypothetical protein
VEIAMEIKITARIVLETELRLPLVTAHLVYGRKITIQYVIQR